ncbi:MAG TPA: zinc-binding alcohol dehydrogenase family protein [Chloroflexota bacterium]|nr:zinc-binding alcohol dehydrogenase family protein [Chloroflexota bacterium]
MKAAVLHQFGETPRYEDFPDPMPGEGEVLIDVRAVALENVDRMMAAGTHYASRQFLPTLPAVVGFDGIGALEDGSLVGFGGMRSPYGAMADWAVVPEANTVPLPPGIDAVTAAAFPTAITAFTMRFAGELQPGGNVLIQGATGAAGRVAVRVARLLGAGRVVATGRNRESLEELKSIGADAVIDLMQPDEALAAEFKAEAAGGYDVVLDFLWGRPTEVLIKTFIPGALDLRKRVRLVQVGEAAGPTISLPADSLRTSGLEICGGSAGVTAERMTQAAEQVAAWIRAGQLQLDVLPMPLRDIEGAWKMDFHGRRVVIVPPAVRN